MGDPCGKTYLRNAANDAWISVAVGSGTSGSGTTFTGWDTDFSVYMSAAKTVANLTTTKIDTFDTILIDTNSEWDAVNLCWTCKTGGTYIINVSLPWDTNGTGYRTVYIYIDGVAVQTRNVGTPSSAATTHNLITHKTTITAGQYVEIYGRQSSGGNLDVIVGVPAAEWQIWRYK